VDDGEQPEEPSLLQEALWSHLRKLGARTSRRVLFTHPNIMVGLSMEIPNILRSQPPGLAT